MPEEGIQQIPHEDILTYDEILRVCRCMTNLGIRKIKLTGGEPLVRKDCVTLVRDIKNLSGIEKVTITTNGILLDKFLPDLIEAGIDGINISLDTLDPKLFAQLTRRDGLQQVLSGLKSAIEVPDLSVKINCVPLIQKKENLIELAGIAKDYPVHVRFIEMMPLGYGKQFPFLSEEDIKGVLMEEYGEMKPSYAILGNGPCHYYTLNDFCGKIGFISAMTHKFCHKCNRVRLTAEGYLKGCLQYQIGKDLRMLLRNGSSDEELTKAIREVIVNKPVGHHFYEMDTQADEMRVMSQIGG